MGGFCSSLRTAAPLWARVNSISACSSSRRRLGKLIQPLFSTTWRSASFKGRATNTMYRWQYFLQTESPGKANCGTTALAAGAAQVCNHGTSPALMDNLLTIIRAAARTVNDLHASVHAVDCSLQSVSTGVGRPLQQSIAI